MTAVLDELTEQISEMDACPEREELERTHEICQRFAYEIAEGLMEVEKGDDGELRFFPAS